MIFCDFQDHDRSAARHALVKILELHGELKDLGLYTDADPDASPIIAAACRSFGLERIGLMAGFPSRAEHQPSVEDNCSQLLSLQRRGGDNHEFD